MRKEPTAAERRRDDDFDAIMEGLGQAVEHAEGRANLADFRVHAPDKVDVKSIRQKMGLSQAAFAASFGLPKATVEDWEQNRRQPDTGSRLFLKVVERDPDAVRRALS